MTLVPLYALPIADIPSKPYLKENFDEAKTYKPTPKYPPRNPKE